MRLIVDKALKGANSVIGRLVERVAEGNQLSEDEKRFRYEMLHQGNPLSTLVFASREYLRKPQPGTNPLQTAIDYERKMEQLRSSGGGN